MLDHSVDEILCTPEVGKEGGREGGRVVMYGAKYRWTLWATHSLSIPPSLPPSLLHQGVAEGIRHGDEVAKAKYIIGDPSYFPKSKTKVTGR